MSKTVCMFIIILFAISGCKEKSKRFTAKDFAAIELGTSRDEIVKRFGKPHGEAFGMFADFYTTSDSISIGIYYDKDGNVQIVNNPLTRKEGIPLLYYTAEQLHEKLLVAADSDNKEDLDGFFSEWDQIFYPNSEEFINSNDTLRAIYSAYKAFYNPYNLLAYGDPEWGNRLNEESRYAVIQNEISYTVLPVGELNIDDYIEYPLDTLHHFRPPVNIEADKVLYMTDEYHTALHEVLALDPEEPDAILSSANTYYRRLRQYIPILQAHWSRHWHMTTHPHVMCIVFNNNLSSAKVSFRIGYQGGSAMMEKNGDEWELNESKLTWIE